MEENYYCIDKFGDITVVSRMNYRSPADVRKDYDCLVIFDNIEVMKKWFDALSGSYKELIQDQNAR